MLLLCVELPLPQDYPHQALAPCAGLADVERIFLNRLKESTFIKVGQGLRCLTFSISVTLPPPCSCPFRTSFFLHSPPPPPNPPPPSPQTYSITASMWMLLEHSQISNKYGLVWCTTTLTNTMSSTVGSTMAEQTVSAANTFTGFPLSSTLW